MARLNLPGYCAGKTIADRGVVVPGPLRPVGAEPHSEPSQ